MEDLVERLRSDHTALNSSEYYMEIYRERREAADEIERLRAALDALRELHTFIDFEEPVSPDKPMTFEDPSGINAALERAYAAIKLNRVAL